MPMKSNMCWVSKPPMPAAAVPHVQPPMKSSRDVSNQVGESNFRIMRGGMKSKRSTVVRKRRK